MILFRYISKEIAVTLAALTTILLLIFLSNQFVHYLTRAATGNIPTAIVLRLMMLEIPNLLGYLLPLGFYIAILVALGRLYVDSEMTVLSACGFSDGQLAIMIMSLALGVSIIVGVLVLWLGPIISVDRDHLMTGGGAKVLVESLVPGRFQSFSHGRYAIFVKDIDDGTGAARKIFLARLQKNSWNVVTAKLATQSSNIETGESFVTLSNGHVIQGTPGQTPVNIVRFQHAKIRLPVGQPRIRKIEDGLSTIQLWQGRKTPSYWAALQWRLSIPLMVLVLALLSLPLAKVNPRQGKFAKLLPAILIYIVYANAMFFGRTWLKEQVIPECLGMWWIHAAVIALALSLILLDKRKRWQA